MSNRNSGASLDVEGLLERIRNESNPALQSLIQGLESFKHIEEADDKTSVKVLSDLITVLEEYEKRKKYGGHLEGWFEESTPFGIDKLPKHRAFFDAGEKYRIRAFIAGNRVGKTVASTYEAACHATGLYPDWWKGKRFNRPVKVWACGISWGQVKETILSKLYGTTGNPGTGLISPELILKTTAASGIPGALESIVVKHTSGGSSVISFKTYEQGIRAFQGAEVDVVLMDEEPPYDIYDECDVRLMTTGGIMMMTFTPQMGLTPTIVSLYRSADLLMGSEPLPEQVMLLAAREAAGDNDEMGSGYREYEEKTVAVVQVSMYDVPWLSEEMIEDRKRKSPPHLVNSRIYGKVTVGEGTIFPVDLDNLIITPFQIPPYWKRSFGMDVGWNVTACVWGALDPDTDVLYIYSEYKGEQKEPIIHSHAIKQRGDWITGSIDYQANSPSAETGRRLMDIYRSHGLRLVGADKAVDAGILAVLERMTTGRLKIFSNCFNLLSEIPVYRRDSKGKVVKEHDHFVDSLRYLVMGLRHAKVFSHNPGGNSSSGENYREYSF